MILFNSALRTNFSDGILLENYREKEVPKVPPHEADLKSLYEKTLIETIGKLHRNYSMYPRNRTSVSVNNRPL